MAESELVKKDDNEKLGSALQLLPHQKDTQFTAVTKSEAGDLVSLDELYEKTGQEAIARVVEGFSQLVSSGKLARSHGLVLGIEGAESWMELPDRMNAIQGKEGFFSAVGRGFIAIVKAIINFIKGLCNWIYVRVKALLGFGETVRETLFIKEHSDQLKQFATQFFEALGMPEFDAEAYISSLPDNITRTKAFTITKKRIENSQASFDRLRDAAVYIKGYQDEINGWYGNIKAGRIAYTRVINQIKGKIRSNNVTKVDIMEVTTGLGDIMKKEMNPSKQVQYINGLLDILYDVEIEGLGLSTQLKTMRDNLKTVSEKAKVMYNEELHNHLAFVTAYIYKNLYAGGNIAEKRIKKEVISELKEMIDDKDSVLLKTLSEKYPETNVEPVYIEYCNTISRLTDVIELTLTVIQSVEVSIANMMRWESEISNLLIAYITNDLHTIIEAHQKLTPEQREKLEVDGYPRYIEDLHMVFIRKYPGANLPEVISDTMQRFFKSEPGKMLLKNLARYKNMFRGG